MWWTWLLAPRGLICWWFHSITVVSKVYREWWWQRSIDRLVKGYITTQITTGYNQRLYISKFELSTHLNLKLCLFINYCSYFLWFMVLLRWKSLYIWLRFIVHSFRRLVNNSPLTVPTVILCFSISNDRHHDPGGLQLQHGAQPGHGPLLHPCPDLRGHRLL